MEKATIIIMALQLLSFIAMTVSMAFYKLRLVDFFFLACVTFGVLAFVLIVLKDCLI